MTCQLSLFAFTKGTKLNSVEGIQYKPVCVCERGCLLERSATNDKGRLLYDKQPKPCQSQHPQHYQGSWVHCHCDGCDSHNHDQVVHFEVVCVFAQSACGLQVSPAYCKSFADYQKHSGAASLPLPGWLVWQTSFGPPSLSMASSALRTSHQAGKSWTERICRCQINTHLLQHVHGRIFQIGSNSHDSILRRYLPALRLRGWSLLRLKRLAILCHRGLSLKRRSLRTKCQNNL